MHHQTLPAVTFSAAWTSFWDNLFNFTGRATRAEYWWMMLVLFGFSFFTSFIPFLGQMLSVLLSLLTVSIFVRRFHDAGYSTIAAVMIFVTQFLMWLPLIFLFGYLWVSALSGSSPAFTVLAAAGVLFLAALAVLIFGLVVTLLPSRPDNVHGPQRAGRVLVPDMPSTAPGGSAAPPYPSPPPPPPPHAG